MCILYFMYIYSTVLILVTTVESRLTVTSLVRSPHHYGHPWSVPNCIIQGKLAPCNKVTSPLRSLLLSPAGDHISEVPLYNYYVYNCSIIMNMTADSLVVIYALDTLLIASTAGILQFDSTKRHSLCTNYHTNL